MVRDVGADSGLRAEFDVRTAYDFSISLFELSLAEEAPRESELPAEDRRWLAEARSALPDRLRESHAAHPGILGSLLVGRPEVRDAAAFAAAVRQLSGREFAAAVLADHGLDPAREPEAAAALEGDSAAIESVLSRWPESEGGVERIFREPDAMAAEMAELMEAWLPPYREVEPRVREIIERDVALRARDRERLGATDLVERTTSGIRWLSEPGVRQIVLAPSYFARPYNFTFTSGQARVFVYPVADEALEPSDPLAPPAGVLRLHRALGDGTRLRILRLLRDRDCYLTEISERLGLSKPTIKHHLVQLRAAGLVTLTEEGGLTYFSLRRERLDDASAELKRYLT